MFDPANTTPLGFRILGSTHNERRLVDWNRAFAAHCAADARAGVNREAYLSAFTFGEDFSHHLRATLSTKGYAGPCGASWLWFDLDRDEASGGIEAALADARTLCVQLANRFGVMDDELLCFYSGSKGFHVGLPTGGFMPEPGAMFHRIARRFAEQVARTVGVLIDTGVYDKVRSFRAPNSKHPRTGRHKRRFTVDELLHLSADRIISLSAEPQPFDVPSGKHCAVDLPAAWNQASEQVRSEAEAEAERRAAVMSGDAAARVNRATLEFIRDGAPTGDRHRLLFSAAANLAECGAPIQLCRELLTEMALDSGLPPADIDRQIRCGVEYVTKGGAA